MVDITASTTHKVKKTAVGSLPAKKGGGNKVGGGGKGIGSGIGKARTGNTTPPRGKQQQQQRAAVPAGAKTHQRRGSVAPALRPGTLDDPEAVRALLEASRDEQKLRVRDMFRNAIGEHTRLQLQTPHAASTTRDRGAAAADVAAAAKELGAVFVLKECEIVDDMQRILFPQGIEAVIGKVEDDAGADNNGEERNGNEYGGGNTLKPSASAVSLSSMCSTGEDVTSVTSITIGTDSKRGKTTPPNAREGCLLLIRALCEITGRDAEPYVNGAFLAAALDECASAVSSIRAAAEDATTALVAAAHPWSVPSIVVPLLLLSLKSTEWRVKAAALERIQQCTTTAPRQVHKLIPTLIPALASQVWDTKAQVSKGARNALLAVCGTNVNPDIAPTIPAIVNAISKPADTNKAVSELMGTTFVVPVDAATLAILCPVLARALKEKLAVHKRAACIVVTNMSKLVVTPQAVAPFGHLLVPELKRVTENVQFEEIRDEALKALSSLTKALGDLYSAVAASAEETESNKKAAQTAPLADATIAIPSETEMVQEILKENERARAEQERIEKERDEEAKREEEIRRKEEEERRKFKEAMEAQRELDKLAFEEAQKKKQEEELKREKQKLSTKSAGGICQGCGLKKCKKSCLFYGT